MSRIAYVNGRYLPQRDASVNIEDRGYQFADGIYEVIYLHAGRFVDETLHFDRLDRSLREMSLMAPMPRASLRHVLQEVAQRNRVRDGLLYMQITRGVSRRDHAFPKKPVPPALVVTVRHIPPYPKNVDAWSIRAITHPDQRWARCDIKSTALLPNVLARQGRAAKGRSGGDFCLMPTTLSPKAPQLAYGSSDAARAVLRVRHLDDAVLPGCTRAALLAVLEESDISVETRAFKVAELRGAQEVFITSASSFVKPRHGARWRADWRRQSRPAHPALV